MIDWASLIPGSFHLSLFFSFWFSGYTLNWSVFKFADCSARPNLSSHSAAFFIYFAFQMKCLLGSFSLFLFIDIIYLKHYSSCFKKFFRFRLAPWNECIIVDLSLFSVSAMFRSSQPHFLLNVSPLLRSPHLCMGHTFLFLCTRVFLLLFWKLGVLKNVMWKFWKLCTPLPSGWCCLLSDFLGWVLPNLSSLLCGHASAYPAYRSPNDWRFFKCLETVSLRSSLDICGVLYIV